MSAPVRENPLVPPFGKELTDALRGRLGNVEFERRVHLEEHVRKNRGKGQGKGIFRIEHRWSVCGLVGLCLRWSGLRRFAERNYLDIRVERNDVALPRLPPSFEDFTLLHLSDLHADLHPAFPAAAAKALASLEYDCVVITGDFRTCTFSDPSGATRATAEILKDVTKPCYAILGNHDSIGKVPVLEKSGVRFLLNENIPIERDGDKIWLAGVDDPNFYQTHNLNRALDGVPAGGCKLLLAHSPQIHAEAAAAGVDLLLAGHTHGGQICLPGGGILVHDGSSPRRLLAGPWCAGSMAGYTSRGTGATGVAARLNCPPEVTLHRLRRGTSLPGEPS